MRHVALPLAALLMASCNAILGNGDNYLVDAGAGSMQCASGDCGGSTAHVGDAGNAGDSSSGGKSGTAGSDVQGTDGGSGGALGAGSGSGGATAGNTASAGAGSGGVAGLASAGYAGVTGGSAGAIGGTGGAATGGHGGASGGNAGAAGGGGADLLGIVGAWDGALAEYPCGPSTSGYDCPQAMGTCNGTIPLTIKKSWTMGGSAGAVYSVTFRVRGVVEVTSYAGGTRDSGTESISASKNLFQRGGSGGTTYGYNAYQLDVTPPVSGEPNTYFLNSVNSTEDPHVSSVTIHLTFAIDYSASIKVPGQGTVTLTLSDLNCQMQMNCGSVSNSTCLTPVTVSLQGARPPAPSSFMQPFAQTFPTSTSYGQWLFFDITAVTQSQ